MNAKALLRHYERIADGPDAVERLRRFVRELAIRGKLLPQQQDDERAAVLLGRIAGELPRTKPTQSMGDSSPFDAPRGWVWTRLGNLVTHSDAGWSPQTEDRPRGESEWGVLKVSAVSWGAFKPEENKQLLPGTEPRLQAQVAKGDFLISRANTAELVARAVIVDNEPARLMMSDKIVRLRLSTHCDHHFVLMVNNYAAHSREHYARLASGVSPSMKNVSRDVILGLPFPLPPLAEQQRIVAKVNELMSLCDQLEAARAAREATRDQLVAASLARLNTPDPDPETFKAHASFAINPALPALTTRPDQIKQLRQTILNLAVRGKLSVQDPSEIPALAGDTQTGAKCNWPFDIPDNWRWSRLTSLGTLKGGGTPSKARHEFWIGKIPWVSPKDMKVNYIADAQMHVSNAAIADSAATLIETGSILFVVRGMILAHSFPIAITHVPVTINQDMKALTLKRPEMAEYVLRALKGLKPEMLTRVQRSSHGTCRLEGNDYSNFSVPIPPIAEQSRIVTKVNELMQLCDQLEASLESGSVARRRLLDALLYEALAPAKEIEEAA